MTAFAVTAVVPVKPLALAKSRLALPPSQRRALALAFAQDTVAALTGSPLVAEVLVVTADPQVRRGLLQHGVRVVAEDGFGLAAAVDAGCRAAAARAAGTGLAVVPSDLPCLSARDVTLVLEAAQATNGAFVADRATTGTTLVVSPPGRSLVLQYGPGSAARHLALHLRSLAVVPDSARLDVDTLEDLHAAAQLGLGPATSREWEDGANRRWG